MPKQDGSLSELARELLAAERVSREPEGLKQRALARALHAAAERPSSHELSRSLLPRAVGLRGRRLRFALLTAAAVAIAGLATAGMGLFQKSPSEPPVRAGVGAPARTADKEPVPARPGPVLGPAPSVSSQPSSALRVHTAPTTGVAETVRPPSARTYAIELALLEPARSSIARGDYAGALGAVARHQREFPNGQLAEERSALRVRALWGLGRIAEAETAAAAFRQRYPRSALLAWMRQQRAPLP